MKFSTRITIAMVALVLFTAAAIAVLVFRDLESVLVPRALERMQTHATLRATELEAYVRGATHDVLGFRSAAAIDGIIQASINGGTHPLDGTSLNTWRERLAKRFVGELQAKSSYLQFRIIGVADGGREIVRVERTQDGTIRIVANDYELQRNGDNSYFKEAIEVLPGDLYVSTIELNREWGEIDVPHIPVLRVAAPLAMASGVPFGILIINVNMRPAFDRIRATVPAGTSIYVVNERGDFLVHPDPRSEFAFEFGRVARLQDGFPALAEALSTDQRLALVFKNADGVPVVGATAVARFADKSRATVIGTARYALIMQPGDAARRSILLAALVAVLGAFGLAVWLARSMTRPLEQMTEAVQSFAHNAPTPVPIAAKGEVGVLAREFSRIAGEVRDKTAALEREVAERRRMFETSLDLILVVDRKGTFLRVSPSSKAILGYQPEEMALRSAAEFIYPEDLESTRNEMRMARRGRHIRNFETRYLRKDGNIVTLAWTGVWSEPEQQHFFIGRDMTEQKLAQDMFRLAVEACSNGMVMFDSSDRIVLVNTEVERQFGYARDELIGKPAGLLLPDGLKNTRSSDGKPGAARPGEQNGHDLLGIRKDGTKFPIELGINPIPMRERLLVLAVIVDISERRRNDRLKDEFVSTVSHELRTPLTSIAGSLGLLAGGAAGPLAEPTMRLLKIAHKNSERLVRLINDILDIEKIESGKIVFDLKRVDVTSLVEQAVEANRGFAEGFGVRVRFDGSPTPVFVRADSDRLVQVVTNLLSNAVKFSPRGEEVTVAIAHDAQSVRILVCDRGPGIPDDFKPRIFEKFAQADATDARQKGGTGLGLSIVKQIVALLGGAVGFEAAPGGGTVFHVALPRWEIAGSEPEDSGLPAHILICDDDAAVAQAIAQRLAAADLRADIAVTGSEALAQAKANGYDAILVDLTLPDCDGISLIQELRAQPQHHNTPIVVLSADAARGRDDIRSSSLDVLDWLNKPVDIPQLVEVLGRPLARGAGKRAHVLHIDDDADVLGVVAEALGRTCEVTSVSSIEQARAALAGRRYDLAVVDLLLSQASGLDLLPDLRDRESNAIPVILYSAKAANGTNSAQVQAALAKSHNSIDLLIATLRKRLASCQIPPHRDKEVA
jgi:PAS domain S-box-containing protein